MLCSAGEHIGRESVQTLIGVQGIVRVMNPAEQSMTLKDDLAGRIRVFNPIRAISRVINVGVEPFPAFEEVAVTSTADEDVIPGTEKGVSLFSSCRPELLCVACVLFSPDDLGSHRFKHQVFSFRVLDVV